ncbi:MAG TPA: DUF72 domain-containing protein [Gammaproteobacteria bacterium]|nr:DUF72 domain-containing protein [Gammaproteobacteria bacterium]
MSGEIRIGNSGFHYAHWKGDFYPADLPEHDWFDWYSRYFDTVEINNTFYRLPERSVFQQWRDQARDDFCYAVKFSRYGTHVKRLNSLEPIERFVDRTVPLEDLIGPVLVQLPPNWHVNAERLEYFLAALPDRYRWAFEFRHESWLCDEVYALLEKYGVALCVHDMIENHPRRLTAGWTYLRFHGDHYSGSYSSQFLTALARRLRDYADDGVDVYVYFNNDAQGHAVRNAQALKRYLGNAS